MPLDQLAGDGQADPAASITLAVMEPAIELEDLLGVARRDAKAVVVQRKAPLPGPDFGLQAHHRRPLRAELEGVV